MKTKIIITLSSIVLFFGCKGTRIDYSNSKALSAERYKYELGVFEYSNLKNAWKNNDKKFVKAYVLTFYDEYQFDSKISEFSNLSQFFYGNYDPFDEFWQGLTTEQRQTYIINVRNVYLLYMDSCLFMNKELIREDLWDMQYKYDRTKVLSKEILQEIKKEIESKCN